MAGDALMVMLDEIDVGDGHRAVDSDAVSRLASSIKEIGLQHPIHVRSVRGRFQLIAGRHRIEAVRKIGEDRIPAKVMRWSDAEARTWEIVENLHRAELTTLERSTQIAEYAELAKERRQSRQLDENEKSKREDGRGHRTEGGRAAASRDLGISEASVRRAETIAALTPEGKEAARQAGIDDNQSKLLQAAKAAPEKQPDVIRHLASSKPVNLAPEPINDFESREQWMAYMMRGWNRAPAAWREHFFERVDGTIFDQTEMGAA
jgi:ParB-like chromosome segregation protein Spo0J